MQHDTVYQKYYDEIIILLGTGLRISELCGLTEADIDLDKQLINVDHQLLKIADVGYYVETPKTKSGNRVIPMSEKVLEAFQRVLNKRKYAQNAKGRIAKSNDTAHLTPHILHHVSKCGNEP